MLFAKALIILGLLNSCNMANALDIVAAPDHPDMHPPGDGSNGSYGGASPVWTFFQDYLGAQKYRQENESTYNASAMIDGRKGGTFWYPAEASLFREESPGTISRVEQLFDGLPEDSNCALAFYYDEMKARFDQHKAQENNQTDMNDYTKPVAIAPICKPTPAQYSDTDPWVASALIYVNVDREFGDDAYLIFS